MIIKIDGLRKDQNKKNLRRNLYAMMLLARKLDKKDITEESNTYRLFRFFLSACLEKVKDKTDVITGYLNALVKNDIALIVKTILEYKPIEIYAVPDYDKVAAALTSA